MSRYYSYLNSTKQVLALYKGEEPFASFLKKHFAANKKFGSKDRKQISHLCYCYFRLGRALMGLEIEERILTGLFLASVASNEILLALKPEWNEQIALPIAEKLSMINGSVSIDDIFVWGNELSEAIEKESFILSHLIQPDLFLRIRPGKEIIAKQKLEAAGIVFKIINDSCLALPNTSKVDEVLKLNSEVVVQDYSSQRVGELLSLAVFNKKSKISVWDCCAASGGKSIMAKDVLGDIDLTVSDIRQSILVNLKKRFEEAEMKKYQSAIVDLSKPNLSFNAQSFDLVIADVPCTGSGTWSRTPEQLCYFDIKKIEEYAVLQKKIVANATLSVKKDGWLLYITCSVFKKENEAAVTEILNNKSFELVKRQVIKGYTLKADTMFAALFRKIE